MNLFLDQRYRDAIQSKNLRDKNTKMCKRYMDNLINKRDKDLFDLIFSIKENRSLRHHVECLLLTRADLDKCSSVSGIPEEVLDMYRSILFCTSETPDAIMMEHIESIRTYEIVQGRSVQDQIATREKMEKKLSYDLGINICALLLYGKILDASSLYNFMEKDLYINYFKDSLSKEKISAFKLISELKDNSDEKDDAVDMAMSIIKTSIQGVGQNEQQSVEK